MSAGKCHMAGSLYFGDCLNVGEAEQNVRIWDVAPNGLKHQAPELELYTLDIIVVSFTSVSRIDGQLVLA